jgi:hypothetical protein
MPTCVSFGTGTRSRPIEAFLGSRASATSGYVQPRLESQACETRIYLRFALHSFTGETAQGGLSACQLSFLRHPIGNNLNLVVQEY